MANWKRVDCPNCGGHGVVSRYTYGGTDFLGPGCCGDCGGGGVLFVSEADRVVMYPGGPFRGSWPGAYEESEATPFDPTEKPLSYEAGEAAANETRTMA